MSNSKRGEKQDTTKENQKDALEELKILLGNSKPEMTSNDQSFISSLHSQIVDDFCAAPNKKTKTLLKNTNHQDICGYLSSIAKSNFPALFSILSDTKEEETDNASIYENDSGETKTIYRSNSFDNNGKETMCFDQYDTSSLNEESHGFNLENFSDTFNLNDTEENKQTLLDNMTNSQIDENKSASFPIDTENVLSTRNAELTENYPSIGSDESFQFDDVFAKDILGDLNDLGKDEEKTSKIMLKGDSRSVESLNSQTNKIVDAIVSKLRKQLQPTLDKLSQDSQKYEMIKSIYKLPSISNINDEIKLKYNSRGKKFTLDFDNDIIYEMVGDEIGKTENQKNKDNRFPPITAEEQVRLNFNKFRQLHTILEEESSEKLESNLEEKTAHNYTRLEDSRKIKELKTPELINILQDMKVGKLQNIGKVKHLVSVFECQHETRVNKLDNKALKEAILMELNKRHVI